MKRIQRIDVLWFQSVNTDDGDGDKDEKVEQQHRK